MALNPGWVTSASDHTYTRALTGRRPWSLASRSSRLWGFNVSRPDKLSSEVHSITWPTQVQGLILTLLEYIVTLTTGKRRFPLAAPQRPHFFTSHLHDCFNEKKSTPLATAGLAAVHCSSLRRVNWRHNRTQHTVRISWVNLFIAHHRFVTTWGSKSRGVIKLEESLRRRTACTVLYMS